MSTRLPLPISVLLSGSGTTLQAIIDAIEAGALDARIVAVVSDNANAFGLSRARRAGLRTSHVDPQQFPDRVTFDAALAERIDAVGSELVVLAGYMRILSPEFVRRYWGRMLNIHPSLLPKYRGLDTYRRVLQNGDAEHGTSIHFVTEELDGGPLVLQAPVAVRANDGPDTLSARVQARERMLYPEVIQWFATGRLRVENGRVWLDDRPLEQPVRIDETTDGDN